MFRMRLNSMRRKKCLKHGMCIGVVGRFSSLQRDRVIKINNACASSSRSLAVESASIGDMPNK